MDDLKSLLRLSSEAIDKREYNTAFDLLNRYHQARFDGFDEPRIDDFAWGDDLYRSFSDIVNRSVNDRHLMPISLTWVA